MEGIIVPYPLYKQVRFTCKCTYNQRLQIYWKLIINLCNLVDNNNYGIMTDIQTVFLVELCFKLHTYMKQYLADKLSLYTATKRIESCIVFYNDSIVFSDNKYIKRYIPMLILKKDTYRLSIPWEKRMKLHNIHICYEILPRILYPRSYKV